MYYFFYKRARVCVGPIGLMTYVQIYVECTAYFLIEVYVINHARQATRSPIINLNTPPDNHNTVVRN